MSEYKINYTQSNFTGGIIAAELYGRNDFNKVKTGLKKCTNWTIREAGGLEFRRGTKYLQTVPVAAGTNFRLTSINTKILLFCSDGIRYLDTNNAWQLVAYPTDTSVVPNVVITPDLTKVHFTELKRRLYYYDGTIKLSEVKLNSLEPEDGSVNFAYAPVVTVSVFDRQPQGTIACVLDGTHPDPYVPVDYEYSFSLAKDEGHESIQTSGVMTPFANNAELSPTCKNKVTITIPTSELTDYTGGKLLVYKKYQGYFYFIYAVDVSSGTTSGSDTVFIYEDDGQTTIDMSKSIKVLPPYLASDGTIAYVNSIADYGQRLFLTQANMSVTQIIFSAVGNTDNLGYSALRTEDEAGYLELPISHYDSWCKVTSGLDLILSTSFTINKVQGYGDLTTDTILWDGLSKTVDPVRTRRSLIYTNASNRNIYDLTYNEYGQYDSIDLTLLVKYIFETKTIKRLAFKDYPVKTIYVLCSDGDLYCLTYIKDQNIYAWYKIEHEGTVKDLCVVNTDVEDEVYIVVDYDGTYIVERAYHRTDDVYLDCAIVKQLSEISDNEITGLNIFEGKKVRVFDAGNNLYYGDYDIMNPKTVTEGGKTVEIDDLDFDGYLVESGKIQLPDDIELVGPIIVGLPYYAVMETIPLEFQDQSGNSTIGRKKAVNEAYLRYGDSRGVTYKTMGHEYDCGICERDVADNAQFLERGQVKLHTNSEYKWDSTIKILQRQPYPARVESITLGLTFNDKS